MQQSPIKAPLKTFFSLPLNIPTNPFSYHSISEDFSNILKILQLRLVFYPKFKSKSKLIFLFYNMIWYNIIIYMYIPNTRVENLKYIGSIYNNTIYDILGTDAVSCSITYKVFFFFQLLWM